MDLDIRCGIDSFSRFNDKLWISKRKNFVASLEFKEQENYWYYDIRGWVLTIREKDCVHEKVLGIFIPENQCYDFNDDLQKGLNLSCVKTVIESSFDSRLWPDFREIISRSEELLEALGVE